VEVRRTPEERFADLPGFEHAPRYATVEVDGLRLRMHHVEAGPPSAAPVVLLHGEPTWSFLYRRVIGALAAAGHRALAVDLVGCGRSDKPADRGWYSYRRHVLALSAWLDAVDLADATLVAQDWGGLAGLPLLVHQRARIRRTVASNTGLPTGAPPPDERFAKLRRFAETTPDYVPSELIGRWLRRPLAAAEARAYDAPFPDESYKAALRTFKGLVPRDAADSGGVANAAVWRELERDARPFLTVWGELDPFTAPLAAEFQRRIPGARGRPHAVIPGAGHFIQEDAPEAFAAAIDRFVRASA
jgi:haloalkane dehalogenase